MLETLMGTADHTVYTTDAVYGVSREVPLNYVTRPAIDESFVENLGRDKHIVIFGSSKQGKTCLRKHCLNDDDYIVVQCSNNWSVGELHSNILKRAGFQVIQSEKKTSEGSNKIKAGLKASAFGFGAELGGEKGAKDTSEVEFHNLELDPTDPNDIIAALESINFSKYIVLEDFHYLPTPTQIGFSVGLKAFHEASKFTFILIGVWLDENRLIVYNGDLSGRIVSIDADNWSEDELRLVIEAGAKLLNVRFEESFKSVLVGKCQGSVYIVQEACRLACVISRITRTCNVLTSLGDGMDVPALIKQIVDQQSGRYSTFIALFSGGFQDTTLQMYKWLLHPVLNATSEKLKAGFKYAELRKYLQERHPQGKGLNAGNLTQALQYCASLQVEKNIKPIVLDYDQTATRLNVVDRGFIMWLEHQDKVELMESIGFDSEVEAAGQLKFEVLSEES